MPTIDTIIDELVVSRCRHVEHEIEHHVSRSGEMTRRGQMTRPTQYEFGITALVTWGLMQLAADWPAPSE